MKKLREHTFNEEVNALTFILIQMNDDSEVEFIMNNMSHFAILTERILPWEVDPAVSGHHERGAVQSESVELDVGIVRISQGSEAR